LSIGLLVLAFLTGGKNEDQPQLLAEPTTPLIEVQPPASDLPETRTLPQTENISLVPLSAAVDGIVTHYGAAYNGEVLGCGTGHYASNDVTIIAVGPSRDAEWPCGTPIGVCGPAGCILTYRQDGCPGCGSYHVDLSEVGIILVCGASVSRCDVTIQPYLILEPAPPFS
jgi:hypothetical protein